MPFDRAPGTDRQDRDAQRQEQIKQRAALAEKLAEKRLRQKAKTKAEVTSPVADCQSRDVDGYMNAIKNMPLYRLGSRQLVELTPAYERFVRAATEVASDGSVQVVMAWPDLHASASAIVNLLCIGAVGSADRLETTVEGAHAWYRKSADEVRVVCFPYARSTHAAGRAVQVDRQCLGDVHFEHYTRSLLESGDSAATDCHHVMATVRSLTGLAIDGNNYPEFEHPILDEIVPHSSLLEGKRSRNSSLLWRSRTKTDIGKQKRSDEADDPSKASFYMYAMRADIRVKPALQSLSKAPDLLILDLTRTGRMRLGWNWIKGVEYTIKSIREIHPSAGILAVTDDPWTYKTARFDLLGSKPSGRKGKTRPAKGHVVFSQTPAIVQDVDLTSPEFEGGQNIEVDGFYGEVDRNIEQLRGLARQLAERGDSNSANVTRDVIAAVRRSACLPGSIFELGRFLQRETTSAIASDQLAMYQVGADLNILKDPRSLASQFDAGSMICDSTNTIMRTLEQATPMSTLLEAALQPTLRSSSRSVFVFRSDMVAEFAADRLSISHTRLTERLDSELIKFGGARVLSEVAKTPPSFRNQFKRVVVVAPTRPSILALFATPWLPQNVVILADSDTLAFAARDADRLASELGDEPVAARLRAFSNQATRRVAEIGRHAILIDTQLPPDDVEFPSGTVIDLSGGTGSGREIVNIYLHNGQRIIARPGTGLVLRNTDAATTAFIERPASQVRPGDEVCVIGPAFIESARTLVNIRAAAAAEIREYHEQVVLRFADIPGVTVAERLREVTSRMGEPHVAPETARYWVDLDDELEKPMHEIVPHAPQDRETFMRFTYVLGIGSRLAESFWLWAIVAQRTHRMHSGNVFHDAFRGILTDPHAALASNQNKSDNIRTLLAMADEHVAVVQKQRIRI